MLDLISFLDLMSTSMHHELKRYIQYNRYYCMMSHMYNYQSEAVEMSVYESMAMSCSGWCFQWSKFNSECGSNGIVLSCAPCTSNQWKSMEEELPDFDGVSYHNLCKHIVVYQACVSCTLYRWHGLKWCVLLTNHIN